MKKVYLICLFVSAIGFSQTIDEKVSLAKPYNEEEDAAVKANELLSIAKAQNKNIILQIGGNWCIWCLRLNDFIQKSDELKTIIEENYLYYHLNWSTKNKNEKFFAKYNNPGEVNGYPVFMILDANGNQIHIQETGSLEEDKGYNLEKIKAFLNSWKVSK